MKHKKIVITGPTGVIGMALIEKCIENDCFVLAVCHKESKRVQVIPRCSNVRIVELNLDEIDKLPDMVDSHDYDVFFHLGWDGTFGNGRNNVDGQLKNVQYTLDAVAAAKNLGCKRFLGVGSQAEYGRCDKPLNSCMPAFPENGYGMAKLCAGQMSRIKCEQFGMEHVWARVLSVYGPYDGKNTMIMSTIEKLLQGKKPSLTAGEQIWDYLYNADAARMLFGLAEHGISGRVYCIGSGTGRRLSEYMEELRNQIDPTLPLGLGDISYGRNPVMYLVADITEVVKDTGITPETSFTQGIAKTIHWVKTRG